MSIHQISDQYLDFAKIHAVVYSDAKLELSNDARQRIQVCRDYIDVKLSTGNNIYYGINTGFGALYNKVIPENDLEQLQTNLVMSHACGTGAEVPQEIVKLMLFLKIQGLSYGNSGVQVETVQRLIDFYNNNIYPVIYEQGSLGASGDLAPLAHLTLPLLGMGEVDYNGKRISGAQLNIEMGWNPVKLKSKEGLALLNGTQFMSAYATWSVLHSHQLMHAADVIGSLSLDAFDGRIEPFHELIQQVRPHKGQISTAANFRTVLRESEIINQQKQHVQDPYSFRCIPQVHGAGKDAHFHVAATVLNEINSVTDNPTVFPEEDLIISAGNFHGQPLALVMDYLAIALAELGSISERRTYQLISGQRGLPPFLVATAGLNSGFMIPQYTAAGIVSQNKQLCTPASVDSIVSSNGQEDHVSMGANAATKLYRVVQNVERVIAIELMNAAQAIEFRRPLKTSGALEAVLKEYRSEITFFDVDRILYTDIQKSVDFLQRYNFEKHLN
jgi:histidine ammonia-lyase